MGTATITFHLTDTRARWAVAPGSIHTLDPRLRIVAAVAFAAVMVASQQLITLTAGLLTAVLLAASARLPFGGTLKRLLAVDFFIIVMLLMLPFTVPGETLWRLGSLTISHEGFGLAVGIALKANAVALVLLTLVGTLDIVTLGHALHHLRVPDKLVHLLLFTVRYVEVLHAEYRRLRAAMTARAFRPRSDRHTWSSIGYLFGILLVRSLERSERILAAMKCRGFQGRYYLLDHFTMTHRDGWFALAFSVGLLVLLGLEWR